MENQGKREAVGFTPGPWKVYNFKIYKKDEGILDDVNSTNYIATVRHEGDARLIAAAPAMYALLKEVVNDGWDDDKQTVRKLLELLEGK